jgi:ubiquinone/menaquinone biosynthesis C-methylase UbiE
MSVFRWIAPLIQFAARRWSEDSLAALAAWLRPYVPPGGVLADLGGGTGEIGAGVARDLGARVVIVDETPQMLRRVHGDPHVTVCLATVQALPFPDGYFDAVMCCDSFHHFRDQDAASCEIARVVRPGGGVLVLDPEPTGANQRVARLERLLGEPGTFRPMADLESFMAAHGIVGTCTRQGRASCAFVGSVRPSP